MPVHPDRAAGYVRIVDEDEMVINELVAAMDDHQLPEGVQVVLNRVGFWMGAVTHG